MNFIDIKMHGTKIKTLSIICGMSHIAVKYIVALVCILLCVAL